LGEWRSGSAARLHREGRGFDPLFAHQTIIIYYPFWVVFLYPLYLTCCFCPVMFCITSMFGIKSIVTTIVTLLLVCIIGGGAYLVYTNIRNGEYTPEETAKKFVSLLNNPTDTITPNEKSILSEITQSNVVTSFFDENSIKTFRTFTKDKSITIASVEKTANRYYKANIDIKSTNSKNTITLFMEETGSIWNGGIRTKIYKIDSDIKEKTPENTIQKSIEDGINGIVDKTKELLAPKVESGK
jgi:hypothetical protein